MRSSAQFRYWWTTQPNGSVPSDWTAISDADLGSGGINRSRIEHMAEPGEHMLAWAWDLLQVARASYVADKKSRRDKMADGWTRTIRLKIPVHDPDRWDGAASELLHRLLQTLTADQWDITFQHASFSWNRQNRLFGEWSADEVALFSGGLDSTAFAADLAQQHGGNVLLTMFFDPPTRARQDAVFKQIMDIKCRPVHLRRASQMVTGKPLDPSSRSRGLLYIATATYMAAAHNASRVLVPENGQLALNLPLISSRSAACSTRSVHPLTLDLLNQLITALDGHVSVTNPLGNLTKGEVCDLALDAGLTAETLYTTVSCGHPPHKRRAHLPYHCGYCYPCLVRRAGLWHALSADNSGYWCNPWELPSRDMKREDLLALQIWLDKPLTSMDLIADVPLPAEISPSDRLPVLDRARRELTTMLNDHLT